MKKDTCTIKKGFKNNNGIVKSISHTINNKKNVIYLLHMSKWKEIRNRPWRTTSVNDRWS